MQVRYQAALRPDVANYNNKPERLETCGVLNALTGCQPVLYQPLAVHEIEKREHSGAKQRQYILDLAT